MTYDADIRVSALEVVGASEDDTGLLSASGDVWFEGADTDGTLGWQAVRPVGGDVMVQVLYPDGGERVGSEDEEDPDSYIALMLAHPRVRELMCMTLDQATQVDQLLRGAVVPGSTGT